MRSLITGIAGFVGPYLAEHLLSNKHEVFGVDILKKKIENVISYQTDILDIEGLFSVINEIRPDYVFHLAAQSSVEKSFSQPEFTKKVNVGGTKNLLDSILSAGIKPAILIVSSAQIYGFPKQLPITEQHPLNPQSPYAKSRLEQEKLVLEYSKECNDVLNSEGLFSIMNEIMPNMRVVIARSFNHTGPGQSTEFVCSDFAKQIVEIEKGLKEPLVKVGNLEAKRDFTDVRDIVKGYLLALEKGETGECYNLCSGKAYSIEEILQMLIKESKCKDIKVEKDPQKTRAGDITVLLGDNSKFCKQTGWKLEIQIEQTLSDILEYWRKQIK